MAGALVRAFLVVLLIATPSLLLPGVPSDVTQIVALMSIFAAALTIFEYVSTYPGLVEFRNAPPYNRLRFIALFLSVFMISVVVRNEGEAEGVTLLITQIGTGIGDLIDFPFSPVRQIVLLLPDNTSLDQVNRVRTAAGISYLIAILSVLAFYYFVRVRGWPTHSGPFNIWINLPTFDPTNGGDVVARLARDARVNVVLGFLLPFLIPAALRTTGSLFGTVTLENAQTMIWILASWAFLPASLFMRGLAMARIAALVERKRRSVARAAKGLQPA